MQFPRVVRNTTRSNVWAFSRGIMPTMYCSIPSSDDVVNSFCTSDESTDGVSGGVVASDAAGAKRPVVAGAAADPTVSWYSELHTSSTSFCSRRELWFRCSALTLIVSSLSSDSYVLICASSSVRGMRSPSSCLGWMPMLALSNCFFSSISRRWISSHRRTSSLNVRLKNCVPLFMSRNWKMPCSPSSAITARAASFRSMICTSFMCAD
mmetsp:Transcript_8129/g.20893  ORF Transcript_8129/g.20893 Transcript_8129/m.20893 type:complete len:209 (-) Transcript_8129:99-725(-)